MPSPPASLRPFALLAALASVAATAWASPDARPEPLPVEEAFAASGEARGRDALTLRFDIAEGYYLYRDRTAVELVVPASDTAASDASATRGGAGGGDSARLGELEFPAPLIHEDEYFGRSAVYRDTLEIGLPLAAPAALRSVTLDLRFQGCADFGLCYPPTTTRLEIALPAAPATAAFADDVPLARALTERLDPSAALFSSSAVGATPEDGELADLFGGAASGEPELLPPDVAYVPVVTRATPTELELLWTIEPGYYLYRDKMRFALEGAGDAALGTPVLDPGTLESDEFFGDQLVWRDQARAVLPLEPAAVPGDDAVLEVFWQGCADIGVCFPPERTRLPLVFGTTAGDVAGDAVPALVAAPAGGANGPRGGTGGTIAAPDDAGTPLVSEQGRLAGLLGSRALWLNALTFFGLGLLLAFTPCVLPMIPILSSLIVGKGDGMTTGRALRLSLVYVLVMATTYAVLGVVVGLSGFNVQPMLQDPRVLSAIAALFVLLALAMFGFYELELPRALQERLTAVSNRQKGGEYGGVAVMALLSTLIVGPCITAPLAGALIYIADTGDAAIGGTALFSLGLGMGAPLLLIGTSAGTLLPRAGAWMERVKQLFGVLLLAMAIYMLSRFLDPNVTMALAGALALISGVLFGATDALAPESDARRRLAKGAGLVVSVYGLALLVGALAGGGSWTAPLGPLAARGGADGTGPVAAVEEHGLAFRRVKSPAELDAAVAEASAAGRPLMLDFYADWCVSCKEMEAFTFSDERVRAALGNALLVQADVTANDADDQALLDRFGLFGPPGIIFYDTSGRELSGARVVGFVPAERFAAHVERAIGGRSI